MGRLIDIDRLCNDLMERWSIADKKKEDTIRAVMADVVTPIVASQPTVDAVPVVRCKDCKNSEHWYADRRRCFLWHEDGVSVFDDGFCNYGERKDGDGNG